LKKDFIEGNSKLIQTKNIKIHIQNRKELEEQKNEISLIQEEEKFKLKSVQVKKQKEQEKIIQSLDKQIQDKNKFNNKSKFEEANNNSSLNIKGKCNCAMASCIRCNKVYPVAQLNKKRQVQFITKQKK
jgi:hypothetical protein